MNITMENATKAANEAVGKMLDKLSEEMDNQGMDWTVMEPFRDYRIEVYPDGTCDLMPEIEDVKIEEGKGGDPKTYSLKLECFNCGHKWDQRIPLGMDFFPFQMGSKNWEAHYGYPLSFSGHRASFVENSDARVQCPNCLSCRVDTAMEG